MSRLALVPGPLYPDLFDGVTPIMVAPDPDTRTPVEMGEGIPVDPAVQRCPYCGAKLTAYVNEIEEREPGSGVWDASDVSMDCLAEPNQFDPDTEEEEDVWAEWNRQHSREPYTYWLPAQIRVTAWVNTLYRPIEDPL